MLKPFNIAEVQFELGNEIGREGQNSNVHTALDLQLNATLAMKKMRKATFSDVDTYFSEASMLYLSSHPNIVPIHYACQDNEHIYLAMPYYAGGSLKAKLAAGFLTVREIVTYATQILSGLHNIHSKRLIHFDIKPDNILISPRGEALIADFGLAKQTSYSGVAGQDRIYGKMIPPEGFNDQEFSRYFDIYQMGLTLHRMCKGDATFYTEYAQYLDNGVLDRQRFRHAVLNGQFPSRSQYPEHIPQRIIDTINQCLQQSPQDRIQSALDIVNEISDVDGNLLDWRYEENHGARLWSKQSDSTFIQLAVDNGGNCVATKTSASGQVRRVREYCINGISRQQIKSFLRGF